MSNLTELWQNRTIRLGAIFGVAGALVIFIGNSMVDDNASTTVIPVDPKPVEGSYFGVRQKDNLMSQEEASDMVDIMSQDFEKRQRALRATEEEMKRRNRELQERISQQDKRMQELSLQLESIAKGQGSVAPRQTTSPAGAKQPSQQQATSSQPQGGAFYNGGQQQVVTRGPYPNSPIIRTITKRTITTLNQGEVTQQNVEINTINGRNGSDRVEPFSPEYREPLVKQEEEGLELFTLSMGSIISGTLLNGVAAPTSTERTKDPMPVLMRVKREALMPNDFTLDIIDCHMLGSAIGDLGSNRVLIRAEAISCNTHTGEAIEQRIMAYAVDSSDGLAGISGDVVYKSGAMIANALKASFISGFANALAPQNIQSLNTSPGATQLWQQQNLDRAAGAGIGKGFSSAADRIADYYLELSESAHPVIELVPGIEVDFIVQRGMTLRLGGRKAPYTNNMMENKDTAGLEVSLPSLQGSPPEIPDLPSVSLNIN